jgi:hypothetical protein
MFGRPIHDQKRDDETHEQFDERSWKKRCNVDAEGRLVIGADAVHRSLLSAGRWLSMKLVGKKTYTKRFEAGLVALKPTFPISNGKSTLTPDDCEKTPLYVPSDGKKGGSKRVWRIFPVIKPGWQCSPAFIITDESLLVSGIFEKHIQCAGLHDGMGAMRIGTGGRNGMYTVANIEFEPYEM